MNIDNLLGEATAEIADNYFQLPIDGQEDAIYRERVYCYELYHQFRCAWPDDCEYELSGEVDKSGHPLIRGNDLDRVKPDLLIHQPGNMSGNHTIIEVKPINASSTGVAKDLATLTAFRRNAGYRYAIYLVYGHNDITQFVNKIRTASSQDRANKIDLSLIELWWHSEPGVSAEKIEIDA
ncbi:hypothetical protein ACVT98_09870 [Vibrio campbellii]